MRQRILALNLALGAVVGAAGCSTGSSGTTAATPPPSAAVSSALGSAAASASAGASAAASGADAFLGYLRDTFPDAAWAQAVRGVQVVDGRARVDTTLGQDAGTAQDAQQLCTAIRAFVPTGGTPVSGVTVLDRDGQTLVEC